MNPGIAARLSWIAVLLGGIFGFAAGVVTLAAHFWLFLSRAPFALDLEWMEGGMLLHALRIAHGQSVYPPPSLEFIPYLYTPLYPALLALLSAVFPLGYLLGRAVSITAFAGALTLLVLAVLRESAGKRGIEKRVALALALGGAGVVASGFVFSGTFYDLVRADALLLLLEAGTLVLALTGRGLRSAAVAGLLIALAFFTKQTASVIGLCIGAGLLVANWRRGLVYGAVAAVVLATGILTLNIASDGWFWTYTYKLHQSHGFNAQLAYVATPLRLFRYGGPLYVALMLSALGLGLQGRLTRLDAIHGAAAVGGFAASCIGFGTQWAFENAFIPAIYFPALSAAVMGARLAGLARRDGRLAVAAGAVGALVALAFGLQIVRAPIPDRQRWVPGGQDHAAAAAFLARLRGLEGKLFIPFHPYYAVLAGKPPHVHRMGVLDVAARLGRPAQLDEALATQRFGHVILDWKSQPYEWPTLTGQYHPVHEFRDGVDAVRSFSGAETSPRILLAATRRPPPLPPTARRLADFESGWNGFVPSGSAFGAAPAPALAGLRGRAAADSRRYGNEATGTLRSAPFVLERSHLRFTLVGPADASLRVLLLDGPEAVRIASPQGGGATVEWDLTGFVGRTLIVLIEDGAATGGLAVDELVEY
jgi:hypothetical protein